MRRLRVREIFEEVLEVDAGLTHENQAAGGDGRWPPGLA